MKHVMKLNEKAFNRMKEGSKKREYRVNDHKRKLVRIGDRIEFRKLPDLQEKIEMDVQKVEVFSSLEEAITPYFEEDFSKRHKDKKSTIESFYKKGFVTKEEEKENGVVVFTLKKHRITHYNSAATYLKMGNKILMLKYAKKWGHIYAPPGGKLESGESPLDCAIREFQEETGLTLIKPKLKIISYWKEEKEEDSEGIVFIYIAEKYEGNLKSSEEGSLHWINIDELPKIKQFKQNEKFMDYLFKDGVFEGRFLFGENNEILDYVIKEC